MAQDHEAEQQSEGRGGNHGGIDRGNALGVVSQKALPRRRGWPPDLDHVSRHGRLRHVDPDLQELAVDPRHAPQGIPQAGLANQASNIFNIFGNPWPAGSSSGSPMPQGSEVAPVPAHSRLRPDNDDRVHNVRPKSIEPDEQRPICVAELRSPRSRAAQHIDLTSQGEVLGLQPLSRLEPRGETPPRRCENRDHRSRSCQAQPSGCEFATDGILGNETTGASLVHSAHSAHDR